MTEADLSIPPVEVPVVPVATPEPRSFWCAQEDLVSLQPPTPVNVLPALERLGPSPFPKSRFRFLSFLATVYDHVAARVENAPPNEPAPS